MGVERFNRTFVVLKLIDRRFGRHQALSFNRTFVVLKCGLHQVDSVFMRCFNRTFVVLKLLSCFP